ncbi:MAG: sigma-70 family RNA polymerase sigma factor [Planctomycetia bacterium]|nr:sigma-70 family RNA polymerase sigma factor [Planctomycetia bacterium]
MTAVTEILNAIEQGNPAAAEQLLPLVYDELRKLASARLAQEKPGQTLQATALVHEAYLRLLGPSPEDKHWENRGHFFAAAAEAIRRILIENVRRKRRIKHGGDRKQIDIKDVAQITEEPADDLIDLDEALRKLEDIDADAAQVIKLRYFAGLTMQQTADALGFSLRTTERNDAYARTWLHRELIQLDSEDAEAT